MKFKLNKTRYTTKQIMQWLWSHHKGCRTQAIANMAIGLVLVITGLINVELIYRLTDVATHSREGSLWTMCILLALVFVFNLLIRMLKTWIGAVLGVKTQNKMQQYFFARILGGKWSGIERFHSGDVLNRLFGDVNDIVNLMTEVLPYIVVIISQFLFSFVYLFLMDRSLAIIVICVCPIFLILSRIYFSKMRRYVRKVKDSNSAIQAIIQESIQHKMVIKVLEQGETMINRLDHRQSLLRSQVKSKARFSILAKAVVAIGFTGSYLVALAWALFQLNDGLITYGVLIAFTQLVGKIQRPLEDMARILPSLVNSLTSSERLMELEELPLEPIKPLESSEPSNASIPAQFNCANPHTPFGLRFENVTFRYPDISNRHIPQRKMILKSFSYDFAPRSFTAILGPTGSGKTTLLRLMLALVDPQEGEVSLYNTQSETFNATPSLRSCFSYVPQGNTLFSGTILDNLRFGKSDATVEEMKEALRLANAEFVFDFPEGLYTHCGEHGGGLSEGQAQRIAIARAILRPCKVLLLDEATSALDIDTEKEVLTRIKNHFSDTTIIFVTHRLSAVPFATNELKLTNE